MVVRERCARPSVQSMARPTGKSRVTPKKPKPKHGDIRERKHGDHFHTERWCENHKQWEPVN